MDLAVLFWMFMGGWLIYTLGEQGVRDHWSLPRWILGSALLTMVGAPVVVALYLYWVKGDR